jgi:hypothetical protein
MGKKNKRRKNKMIYKVLDGKVVPMDDDDTLLQNMTTINNEEDDDWGNTNEELNIVTACGHKPQSVNITLSRVVKNKINLLMKKYQHTEWLAYLIGNSTTNIITDLEIPKQRVNAASVHVEGPIVSPFVIGVIHSHHSMGAFFSGTDNEYINGNHGISIVVANNGIKAQVRWNTPCGSKMIVDGNVIFERENLFDEETFINNVVSVISENIPAVTRYTPTVYTPTNTNFQRKLPVDVPVTKHKYLKGMSEGVREP